VLPILDVDVGIASIVSRRRRSAPLDRRLLQLINSLVLLQAKRYNYGCCHLRRIPLSTYGLVAIQTHFGRFEEITGIHVEFMNTLERHLLAYIALLFYF
jgi:hypothetical protein